MSSQPTEGGQRVESPPVWLREQHTGRILVGWRPCDCGPMVRGHRRYDLACCGQVFVDGCTRSPTPTPCRASAR